MIVKYHPRYLKAIKDISKRDGATSEMLDALEIVIRKHPELTFVALNEEGKFKGYTTLAELKDGSLFVIHWSSKEKSYGYSIFKHAKKELTKTYKGTYVYFNRHGSKKIQRRKL